MDQNHYQPRHSQHNGTFSNDGWFPDLDINALQKRLRLDSSITIESIFESVLQSVILINQNLAEFASKKKEAGYNTLADVPSISYQFINEGDDFADPADPAEVTPKTRLVKLYENAIFYRVKGDLTRENSHHTLLEEGKKRQNDYDTQSGDFYRQSTVAVRLILGKKATRSRLL